MRISFFKYLGHKKSLIAYSYVCTVLALATALLPATVGIKFLSYVADRQETKLVQVFESEQKYLLETLSNLGSRQEVIGAIKDGDRSALLSLFKTEKINTKITDFAASDKNGIVISRTNPTASVGDNVFLTFPAGRLAAQGLTGVIFGPGRDFPLTMAAVYPIKGQSGELEGALFGGYWFDDEYAVNLKEKYLSKTSGQEIIFYSKDEGITGTTITDPSVRKNLRAYINHGSLLTKEKHQGEILNFSGKDYIISNYVFPKSDDLYGGVLLLTPLPATLLIRTFVISFLWTLLFFLIALFGEKVTFPALLRMRKKYLLSLLTIVSIVVWVSLWFGIYYHTQKIVTYVEKQKFSIYNSTFNLQPSSGIYVRGYSQQSSVIIHSGGEDINAVEVHLRFDPSILSIDSLSFDRSICTKTRLVENTIDNENGTLSISCVVGKNAFDQEWGVIADIQFTPYVPGSALLSFDEGSQVLAADGLGTNVLRSVTSSFYRVFDEVDIIGSFSKKTILIPYSQTHENSAKWYNSKHVIVSWLKIPDAEYMYEFSDIATTTLINPSTTSAKTVSLDAPNDGVFYFRLAPIKNGIPGAVSTLKIKIDTTPPDTPTIRESSLNVTQGDVVRFELSSSDDESGLQKNFYVKNDGGIWLPAASKLYIPFTTAGEHTVSVRVFDNAENYSDAEVTVRVRK